MHSELIIMVLTGEEDFTRTWRDLEQRHGGQLFKLSDVALIQRATTGELLIQTRRQDGDSLLKADDCLAGVFAGVLFDDYKAEGRRQIIEAGLDPRFLIDVNQALKPDTSACLIYVPQDRLVDTRRYLVILGQAQGDLYHTIFQSQVEEALLSMDS